MAKQFNYKLPDTYVPDSPGATPKPLNIADIQEIDIGVRRKDGAKGVYPIVITDVTFQPDANGISHEPISSADGLLVGTVYLCAARAVMKDGGISDWSAESNEFSPEPRKPGFPTGVSVS